MNQEAGDVVLTYLYYNIGCSFFNKNSYHKKDTAGYVKVKVLFCRDGKTVPNGHRFPVRCSIEHGLQLGQERLSCWRKVMILEVKKKADLGVKELCSGQSQFCSSK